MSILYETTQQFLTYLIEFFGFVALFILPCEYIIKCHFDEVKSWGRPEEGLSKTPNLAQAPLKNQDKKEQKPAKQRTSEDEEPTTTKTKRRKKTELVTV